jgi:acetylornithine deacetylase/succinyl-diaminopimelate desuccinylase-like protein
MQDELGVVELASQLVRIPSVTGDEGRLGTFLAEWLAEAGLHVETDEVAPNRWNVLAIWPASAGNEEPLDLLFHAHMDTVPPHGMRDPFAGRVEKGQLWGRGAVDQKGGLAAAAAALVAHAKRRSPSGTAAVGLVAVVDEESEHRGSMALAQSGLQAKRGIVTEPSGLRVVVGCKGTVPLLFRVHGKAAHGCRPWLGVNAVEKAMQLARQVLSQDLPEAQVPGLPNVRGTINLGVVEGGVAYNIVPDRCELWFDRRTVPGEAQAAVLAEMESLVASHNASDPSARVKVEIARPDWHWEPIAERGLNPTLAPLGSGIADWVDGHHQRIVGHAAERYFTDGYNEMDFMVNDMAIPTVQYGPGDSTLCHTDEEKLDLAQLLACARVYASLIEDAAGLSVQAGE